MTEPSTSSSSAQPSPEPPTRPAAQPRVQNPLTLIMPIKSPEDYQELFQQLTHFQSLPPEQNPLNQTLVATGVVHFARFVFLENNTKMGVITTYDGPLGPYVNAFIDKVGKVFDLLLSHMADAPPLPVEKFRKEFLQYVVDHDVPVVEPFFSAYPTKTVLDILSSGD